MNNVINKVLLHCIIFFAFIATPVFAQKDSFVQKTCERGKITFQHTDGKVNESDGNFQIVVSRIGGTCGRASVVVDVKPLKAKTSRDFIAQKKQLTWQDGEGGDRVYTILIVDDNLREPNESFLVTMTKPNYRGLIGKKSKKKITIVKNDKLPTMHFGTGTDHVNEGDTIEIPILLSTPSKKDVTVTFDYTGSATEDVLVELPTQMTIPKGSTSAKLRITTQTNTVSQGDSILEIAIAEANKAYFNSQERYVVTIHGVKNTACPAGADPWSSPSSWLSGVPTAGSAVEIPSGTHIALDTQTPALAGLTINGTLSFCNQDVALTAHWILVMGELHVGSEQEPFVHQATITLTGDTADNIMGHGGSRGLVVMDGILELHGTAPQVTWAKINEHAEANTTQLTMNQAVDWQGGDTIVIAPTDFYGIAETARHQIATVIDDQTLAIQPALVDFRWGRLQYVTPDGMSLTDENLIDPPAVPESGNTPVILDQRAAVGNLTRNIIIQAPNDALWQQQGFGAHLMIMGEFSQTHIDGVEFRRVGQRNRLGRYPYHNHRRSYAEDGSLLEDVTGDYLRNSSIHQSSNRCITIHATNGLTVQNNICYNIRGHGIFFEDAVERRNIVENNLILHVRNPDEGMALKLHEQQLPHVNSGSSGLWVSNPDNTVRNNTAADAQGFGLWMAFPEQPVSVSSNVEIIPNRLLFGNFDGNTTHSNAHEGTMFDISETDDLGNVLPRAYLSTLNGQGVSNLYDNGGNLQRFSMRGLSSWKNGLSGIWNRVVWADFSEFVAADNQGRYIAGSGRDGDISRSLMVGTSLNNATSRPNRSWAGGEVAFASYHSAYSIHDNIIINFPLVPSDPLVEGGRSGTMDTSDFYLRPVEKGTIINTNNLLIDSHPGYRAVARFPYYVLAGALWDPHGYWGPANNWSVYDQPFFTHNANCVAVEPAASSGATSCDGQYYGISSFVINQANTPFFPTMEIYVTRFDETNPNLVIDDWHALDGTGLSPFANMRHFAARQDGVYLLDFPSTIPNDVIVRLDNMTNANDTFVLGIRYSGLLSAQVAATTYDPNNINGFCHDQHCHSYTAVASLADVIASTGETFWQDTANNVVWVKVQGGLVDNWVAPEDTWPFSEQTLYEPFNLRIHN